MDDEKDSDCWCSADAGGCVQVDNYSEVVKAPAPAGLEGYWQSKGPQSEMMSPDAIASLIVTKEGDTLDCRQWQRVIACRVN
jgi:DNA-binding transcriptional regulator of glucitol operon